MQTPILYFQEETSQPINDLCITVGTVGGVGWMRGPCACPCQVYVIRQEYQVLPTESLSNEDKHKAPTPPRIRPLSLQDEDNPSPHYYSVRLSNIITTRIPRRNDFVIFWLRPLLSPG